MSMSHILTKDMLAQKESIDPSFLSKEKVIIHNNLLNGNRAFGKELSNLPITSHSFISKTGITRPATAGGFNPMKPQFFVPEMKNLGNTQENFQLQTVKDPLLNLEDTMINEQATTIKDSKRMSVEKGGLVMRPTTQGGLGRKSTVAMDIEPADLEVIDNPQYVAHYAKEITAHLKDTEEKYLAKPNYMAKSQKDINEKMRAIMIDWLIDVHLKFKLLPETLYLTVNLIDRYLEIVPVARQKLQLLGVACMLIACKYEEIYSPEIKDFVFVTDRAYRREEILEMEGKVLSTLKFNLTAPSSFRFYERFAKLAKLGETTYHLGCYLLELALIEYKMMRYTPSMLACAAVYIAKVAEGNEGWTDVLIRSSKYEEQAVRNCAAELGILAAPPHEKIALTAARRKYALPKFGEVSKIDLSVL